MYGVKQLKFDSTYPDPACHACNNKHLSLFSLGEYCKVYDNKTCCFSDLAKEQIHLCKECIFALRKTKVFQTRCFNAQKIMEANYGLMYPSYQFHRRVMPQVERRDRPPSEGATSHIRERYSSIERYSSTEIQFPWGSERLLWPPFA